jgi:hypothetical protein
MPAFQLTPEQRAAFDRDGVVRLERFFPAVDIAAMADALWADLRERYGVAREQPETWTVARPMHFQSLKARKPFAALETPATAALADALLGERAWTMPARWGQPLVTFRSDAPEGKPVWHFDLPGPGYPWPMPLIRLLTFLEPCGPGGGGTIYVAGSHRLARRAAKGAVPSAKLRRRLIGAHPWFAALCAGPPGAWRAVLDQAAEVDGVEVSVRQMTGEPGDAMLMHPLTLHGLADNDADRPRMMLTDTILARRLDAASTKPSLP